MVDIQSEKLLEAIYYKLTENDCEDEGECPKMVSLGEILYAIKQSNNYEIMDQIGQVRVKPCRKLCKKCDEP